MQMLRDARFSLNVQRERMRQGDEGANNQLLKLAGYLFLAWGLAMVHFSMARTQPVQHWKIVSFVPFEGTLIRPETAELSVFALIVPYLFLMVAYSLLLRKTFSVPQPRFAAPLLTCAGIIVVWMILWVLCATFLP